MKQIKDIEEWHLVVPQSYQKFFNTLIDYVPRAESVRILIVDDIDADGFGSAKIAISKLRKVFPQCTIHVNDKHGFTDLNLGMKYDIVFIVDSSSNLIDTYKNQNQVFVLDHHEYDHSIICPDNVCFINSKDTEELKSISAGMLTYLILTQFLLDMGFPDDEAYELFDLACLTLYSDVVPLDDYVQSCLYKLMQLDTYSNVITSLNVYKDAINRNTLAYTIIPLINYSRRLGDLNALRLLYGDNEELAIKSLTSNKTKSKNILDILKKMGTIKHYDTFSYCDISLIVDNIPNMNIANFKGVHANHILEETGKPSLVGYNDNGIIRFSVRSDLIDSLIFFVGQDVEGGGHKSACGFSCSEDKLDDILASYNCYLKEAPTRIRKYIDLYSIEDLKLFDLLDMAIYNEFRYSDVDAVKMILHDVPTDEIDNIDFVRGKFTIEGYSFSTFKPIEVDKFDKVDVEIIPTLSSFKLGTIQLISTIKEVNNERRK